MSQQVVRTYNPTIFDVKSIHEARGVILTDDHGLTSNERWERETPYLVDLMAALNITENSVVLDYGCGIGRLSRALIAKYGCRVIGVDISAGMRALAAHYVDHERFTACHPKMLDALGLQVDAALSVWVLQHCVKPEQDIARIYNNLKPGSKLFIVNENARFIPTTEELWLDDGADVKALLGAAFTCTKTGKIDSSVLSELAADRTYWGVFAKAN